jgi:L-seryl-tRNA(Ser) seleniumtransferase
VQKQGPDNLTRRGLLKSSAGLALASALDTGEPAQASQQPRKPNVYEALGVRPAINAFGTITYLGGSLMPPEVVAAWAEAAQHFVNLYDLQDRVGERIAKLLNVEAAMVTTGASGALVLGTAAAVTRGARDLIRRLPDTTGMKNEVLLQKSHHSHYDNQLTDAGVKLIDVETPADVGRAVNDRTAMMFFMNIGQAAGKIKREEWVELARRHQVPSLLDAAADVPPVERVAEYYRLGFDMIALSGGKAMCGPNDTGLLLGRKDLIEAAKLTTNPNGHTLGRMMKVGKEDMVALLAAVERFAHLDPQAEEREWLRRIGVIEKAVKDIPTIECERIVPAIANHVPHLQIAWDEKRVRISRGRVTKELAEGDPPILIGRVGETGDKGILVSVFVLKNGEERIVADRLRAVLKRALA